MSGRYESIGRCLDHCESRIELLFAKELLLNENLAFNPLPGDGAFESRHGVRFQSQVSVHAYRLDFVLSIGQVRVDIELDGYEFHRATKEQVDKENERTRILTAEGWRVVRFSGREINDDARGCARSAYELVMNLAKETGAWSPLPTNHPALREPAPTPEQIEEHARMGREILAMLDGLGK